MSGSTAAIITIPIVTAIALFSWLAAVLHANSHPGRRHEIPIRTEVAGGAFQAVEGGRQLMPIPDHRPAAVPGQRAATASETYQAGQAAEWQAAEWQAAEQPTAEQPASSGPASRSII